MKSSASGQKIEASTSQDGASGSVIEVDDATFEAEVLQSRRPVLVDFGATWCGPCKALEPIVEAIARERASDVKVVKIDIDESPKVSQRYQVRGAPTVIVFKNGEKTKVHLGMTTKARLLALLED